MLDIAGVEALLGKRCGEHARRFSQICNLANYRPDEAAVLVLRLAADHTGHFLRRLPVKSYFSEWTFGRVVEMFEMVVGEVTDDEERAEFASALAEWGANYELELPGVLAERGRPVQTQSQD